MKIVKNGIIACALIGLIGCKKSSFLDMKPSTDIVEPKTLADFQQILDNPSVMNYTGSLSQISADEYQVSYAAYQTATATERNGYIWAKDLYGGDVGVPDWNTLYTEVFCANVVLEGLAKSDSANTDRGKMLKGWALFARAFAFYDLARNFCKSYNPATAKTDLGIPLRFSAAVDYTTPRSTLQETMDQIFSDLDVSLSLLPTERPSANLNRPCKISLYALLARIYLERGDYVLAEKSAGQSLALYSALIDYNSANKASTTPFSTTNDELLYNATGVPSYGFSNTASGISAKISPTMISLYTPNDLRLSLYFFKASDGTYTKKRGYNGYTVFPFTGLATDELLLIKAECLARRGLGNDAMTLINQLLVKRMDNTVPYIPISAASSADALAIVLTERKKELIYRGLRWQDLKRLNREGSNIVLSRELNGTNYTLPANDPRYIFPIPDDEILLSGLQQNNR